MQWTKAVWFRDACWALVVWFCAYSVHAVILAQEHLGSELQSLGPAVAYAQPAADRTPLAPPLNANSTAPYMPTPANLLNPTFQADALRLNIENALRGLPLDSRASLPDLDVSALVEKARATQVASATASAGLDAPRVAQVIPPPAAAPTTAPRSTSSGVAAQAQAVSNDPDPLLASTPDANATDPFIVQKAAALGNNHAQIFAFVRDEIGYESYKGSLRGARGTLWSKAGNALDKASLLVALLRASNIPARYVQGTLSDNLSKQLILSMFPAPLRVVGCLDPGTQLADPANDPKLLSETREHYWVQFNAGGSFQDADPTFAEAQIGQTFTAAQESFAEVPDNLRHKVTVRLKRELTFPQSLLGGSTQDVATVLEQTFNSVGVVGKPLSIGHLINSTSIGAIFTVTTHSYSPYIAVSDFDSDPEQADLLRGQDYQEVLTNFPFASQILTGLFLEMEISGPDGPSETFERTLADRVGFAVRQNGGSSSRSSVDPAAPPFVTDFDVATLYVFPGLNSPSFPGQLPDQLDAIVQRLAALPTDDPPSAETRSRLTALNTSAIIAETRAYGGAFLTVSDALTAQIATDALVKAYFDRPRLILASNRVTTDSVTQIAKSTAALDLRRDRVRSIAFPGQSQATPRSFNTVRGVAESVAERDVLSAVLSANPSQIRHVSVASVFEAAANQGVSLVSITSSNLSTLDQLAISAEAKARITSAVTQGNAVLVPVTPVALDGVDMIGWYEIDPATGDATGVTEDGGHGAVLDYLKWMLLTALIISVYVLCGRRLAESGVAGAIACLQDGASGVRDGIAALASIGKGLGPRV